MAPPRIYCCVNGCLNSSVRRPELSFFKLPNEEDRCMQWLALISREDLAGKKAKSYVVCEEHFHAHEILRAAHRKNLKKNSVPSLNLPGDAHNKQVVAFDVLLKIDTSTQTDKPKTLPDDETNASDTKKREIAHAQKPAKRIKVEDDQELKQEKKVFFKLCDKFLSNEYAEIVKAQTMIDPNAKMQNITITTDVNENILAILKVKVENMSRRERICSVIVDAMEIKPHLVYNTKEDKFIGFHEIDGIQTTDPATLAVMIVLRGIVFNWQQPVGFALLSLYRDYLSVTKWIDKLVDRLCGIKLDVRAIISNLEPDMQNLAIHRSIAPEKPLFSLLRTKKLFYIFDASYLLMMVRNSLIKNDFHFKGRVASMEPIRQFYANDIQKSVRLAPKLTENHIDSNSITKNNDVVYAKQLLSNTVAAAILTYIDFYVLDESGRDTVYVIKLVNDLYDLLVSLKLKDENVFKTAFTGDPEQLKLFTDAIYFFQTLKLVNTNTGVDVTSSAKFIEGFLITIGAILLLFQDLDKLGISYIRTKRLSTDVTQNMIKQIRAFNKSAGNPTSKEFISVFRKLFIKDLMKLPAGNNCSKEIEKFLITNCSGVDDKIVDKAVNDVKVKSSEYNQIEIPDTHGVVFLSSYLLKQCQVKHPDCKILQSYLIPSLELRICNFAGDDRYQKYEEYCKATCSSLLVVPPDNFIKGVEMMDEQFRNCLKKKCIMKDVAASIYKELSELKFPLPCPSFPLVYLKKLFIRMRIFHTVQFNNNKWQTGISQRKYFTVPNL